eukprot:CAMPEP_0183486876 /NCGR_PEP_ID=MMETSP0370-20130417/180157_1 /TAXON_ID=268820 /ORGANISM="Peridinium aciculiferum, Strain PAER-2" /LENGTH=115 /DNA_ID=CAMNT_0025680195 /DNA_START=340 /DNA_END=684 /DNA_ORIENTATION=-
MTEMSSTRSMSRCLRYWHRPQRISGYAPISEVRSNLAMSSNAEPNTCQGRDTGLTNRRIPEACLTIRASPSQKHWHRDDGDVLALLELLLRKPVLGRIAVDVELHEAHALVGHAW